MIRKALTLAVLCDSASTNDLHGIICAIGDGYGVQGALLSTTFPDRKVVFVNLKTPLILDMICFMCGVPGTTLALAEDRQEFAEARLRPEISVIAIRANNANLLKWTPIALAFNVVSMQEMPLVAVDKYFNYLRGNAAEQTVFYCCNRICKKLNGGEI